MKLEIRLFEHPIIERDAIEELIPECQQLLVANGHSHKTKLLKLGTDSDGLPYYQLRLEDGKPVARIYETEFPEFVSSSVELSEAEGIGGRIRRLLRRAGAGIARQGGGLKSSVRRILYGR